MNQFRHGHATNNRVSARPWLMAAAWLAVVSPAAAQRWSPDGSWLAFVHADEAFAEPESRLDWLLGRPEPAPHAKGARIERLWAVKVATSQSVLLDQVEGSLTEPSWATNSSALAFGRVLRPVESAGAPARFEVVFQDDLNRKRVVTAWTWPGEVPVLDDRARRELVLAPGSAFVVAPMLKPSGLVLIRVKDGEALKQWPGARHPAWSPDGRLAMILEGTPGRVAVYDPATGSDPTTVTEVDTATVASPRWAADGQTLQILSRSSPRGMRLDRWRVAKGQPPARQGDGTDVPDFVQVGTGPAPVAFGLDHDGENMFQTLQHAGQPSVITWIRTSGGEVHKRFNPLIDTVAIQGLDVSPRPGSLLLAYRPVAGDVTVPPGLCNPTTESFEPLVPDESARQAWLRLVFGLLGRQVDSADLLAAGQEAGTSWRDFGPTRLPIPGALEPEDPSQLRIVRLARLGQAITRRELPPLAEVVARAPRDAWSELIVDYLAGDYEPALRRLDRMETTVSDREVRSRLLGLRAQIHLGLKKPDRAGPIVDYLRSQEGADLAAANGKLGDVTNPALSWLERLHQQMNKNKSTAEDEGDPEQLRGMISAPRGPDLINQELPPRP